MTEEQQKVVDFIKSKKKTRFYMNEFCEVFPEKSLRDVKKILTSMIQSEIMVYWSSGSTTFYSLKGADEQTAAVEGVD